MKADLTEYVPKSASAKATLPAGTEPLVCTNQQADGWFFPPDIKWSQHVLYISLHSSSSLGGFSFWVWVLGVIESEFEIAKSRLFARMRHSQSVRLHLRCIEDNTVPYHRGRVVIRSSQRYTQFFDVDFGEKATWDLNPLVEFLRVKILSQDEFLVVTPFHEKYAFC